MLRECPSSDNSSHIVLCWLLSTKSNRQVYPVNPRVSACLSLTAKFVGGVDVEEVVCEHLGARVLEFLDEAFVHERRTPVEVFDDLVQVVLVRSPERK